MRWILLVIGLILFAIVGVQVYSYFFPVAQSPSKQLSNNVDDDNPLSDEVVTQIEIESFVSGLTIPWSLVFTADNRALVSERPGRIREVVDGTLNPEPMLVFTETVTRGEGGLMGMALHPDYAENGFVYVMLTYEASGTFWNKIERLVDSGDQLVRDRVIFDQIPGAVNHNGGRIAFGPDKMLYVATGDSLKGELAQSNESLAGKVLRLTDRGEIPADNPITNSPIYSMGHRNIQGIAWSLDEKVMVTTEHGPSGFDGPMGGDEINSIMAGANYGWPKVSHERTEAGMRDPLLVFTPAVAPANGTFYSGATQNTTRNHYFFGGLRGEGLFEVVFDESLTDVLTWQKVPGIEVGRIRDVVEGPDGFIYITTSNRDGRGTVREGDDYIYRVRFGEISE